ncbi:MAG: TraR/DksA family transcriptional regulator [Ilumatobacteraceae bacterium]
MATSIAQKKAAKKKIAAKKAALAKKNAALAKKKAAAAKKKKIELAKKQSARKAAEAARKLAKRKQDLARKVLVAQRKREQSIKKKAAALAAKEKAKAKARLEIERKAAQEAKIVARAAAVVAREAERKAKAEAQAAAREAALKAKRKPVPPSRPAIIKTTFLDGIQATKEFDLKFLGLQREALVEARTKLLGQANRLEDEAHALIQDVEMGDVQFDEEGGEGDTMVVERERDLTLSAQARQTVEEIDAALVRIRTGEYGYSVHSGLPIPRERLKALPWTTESVLERVGGIGTR